MTILLAIIALTMTILWDTANIRSHRDQQTIQHLYTKLQEHHDNCHMCTPHL